MLIDQACINVCCFCSSSYCCRCQKAIVVVAKVISVIIGNWPIPVGVILPPFQLPFSLTLYLFLLSTFGIVDQSQTKNFHMYLSDSLYQ